MRKIFLTVLAVLGFALTASAQEVTKKTVKKTETKIVKKDDGNGAKKTTVVLKKDGTPDKRYKKTTTVLKKDGTPDKRYKENQ